MCARVFNTHFYVVGFPELLPNFETCLSARFDFASKIDFKKCCYLINTYFFQINISRYCVNGYSYHENYGKYIVYIVYLLSQRLF